MKTVQVVLDEELLREANRAARKEKVNRSELFRNALREYLKRKQMKEMEERERRAYERKPVDLDEVERWEKEAAWPDE